MHPQHSYRHRVLALPGSLRRGSYNRKLLEAAFCPLPTVPIIGSTSDQCVAGDETQPEAKVSSAMGQRQGGRRHAGMGM